MRQFIDIVESKQTTYRVYHGTDSQFEQFRDNHRGSANGSAPINMMGFNFTDNIELAKSFGAHLITADVTINRPLIINAGGKNYSEFKHDLNRRLDRFDAEKHDGVIIRNYADAGKNSDEYILGNHFIPASAAQIHIESRD